MFSTPPGSTVCHVTYLSSSSQLLWEEERAELELREKQTFIDLGCGNGLLVYLLSSEGV